MKTIDCRSEIGQTLGLVDAIIHISRALNERDVSDKEVQEALLDLNEDETFKKLIKPALIKQILENLKHIQLFNEFGEHEVIIVVKSKDAEKSKEIWVETCEHDGDLEDYYANLESAGIEFELPEFEQQNA